MGKWLFLHVMRKCNLKETISPLTLFFRREVLKAIGADLKDELHYSREMIEEHPKNYQVIKLI